MIMNRIVMDCKTGVVSVVELTDAEIAEAQANTAKEQAERKAKPAEPTKFELLAQINALMEKVEALP
jgi:hypothetical protein